MNGREQSEAAAGLKKKLAKLVLIGTEEGAALQKRVPCCVRHWGGLPAF
jgi:hypothetical protein